jgi:hypothetical protein
MLMSLGVNAAGVEDPGSVYQNPLPNYRLFMREKNQLDDNFYQLNSIRK